MLTCQTVASIKWTLICPSRKGAVTRSIANMSRQNNTLQAFRNIDISEDPQLRQPSDKFREHRHKTQDVKEHDKLCGRWSTEVRLQTTYL